MPSKLPRAGRRSHAGTTLLEVVIAGAIVALFLGSLFALNSRVIGLVKGYRETAAVSLALQDRLEQIRAANWTEILSADTIGSRILALPPQTSGLFANLEEEITISQYPSPATASAPARVRRLPDGRVEIRSRLPATLLASLRTVRLDLRETWRSAQNGRTRIRETSTVIALGGIGK